MEASVHVNLSARADALQLHAPFGELHVPYARISKIAKDAVGAIVLEARGTTIRLPINIAAERERLFALLQGELARLPSSGA